MQTHIERGFETGFTDALSNLDALLSGKGNPKTVNSKDGTNLVYEVLGSGPPLILVSGAMVTRDFIGTRNLAGLLASRFTVYNYDRRGRGDSSDTLPYSIEKEIDDLETMIKNAGGSAHIYGMSSGAILALHAATKGLNILSLILYEPPFVVKSTDRRPPEDALTVVTEMIAQGRRGAAASYFMTKVFGMPAFVPLLMRLTPYWKLSVAVANTIPYDLNIVGDFTIPKQFSSLQTKTLILYGEKTQSLLVHAAEALVKVLTQAKLDTLPNQSHNVDSLILAPRIEKYLLNEIAD